MSDLLEQQKSYYRARANEYDQWFYRKGRFDHGPAMTQQWWIEVEQVRNALNSLPHVDVALEFASGTGIWTAELLKLADRVIALDASPEVQAIARSKMPDASVTYQLVDLFEWEPETAYDLVFAGFWMSHIPPARLDEFLTKVARATNPGGTFFMVDSRNSETSSARDHGKLDTANHRHQRTLNDGRQFEIVKVFYQPDALKQAMDRHGFDADVRVTDNYFIYMEATKR